MNKGTLQKYPFQVLNTKSVYNLQLLQYYATLGTQKPYYYVVKNQEKEPIERTNKLTNKTIKKEKWKMKEKWTNKKIKNSILLL